MTRVNAIQEERKRGAQLKKVAKYPWGKLDLPQRSPVHLSLLQSVWNSDIRIILFIGCRSKMLWSAPQPGAKLGNLPCTASRACWAIRRRARASLGYSATPRGVSSEKLTVLITTFAATTPHRHANWGIITTGANSCPTRDSTTA